MAWQYAAVMKSTDNQASWDFIKLLSSAASVGYLTIALASYSRWPTWDDTNTITVQMLNDATLSSAADDLAVLNGGNAAVIGSEIVQYKTVTDLGGGLYRLSRLLRGRRGSELAMTHAVGDAFVVVSRTTFKRLPMQTAEIGALRHYKAVSAYASVQQTGAKMLVGTGAALKPYAVADVDGTRDGSNNLTITWKRRTRISGEWRDYVDVPLGEEGESYSIDVMNGSTVVRTLTASTQTVAYTAAQQVTDFGSTQASVTVKIYQISAIVGRGFAATETI